MTRIGMVFKGVRQQTPGGSCGRKYHAIGLRNVMREIILQHPCKWTSHVGLSNSWSAWAEKHQRFRGWVQWRPTYTFLSLLHKLHQWLTLHYCSLQSSCWCACHPLRSHWFKSHSGMHIIHSGLSPRLHLHYSRYIPKHFSLFHTESAFPCRPKLLKFCAVL